MKRATLWRIRAAIWLVVILLFGLYLAYVDHQGRDCSELCGEGMEHRLTLPLFRDCQCAKRRVWKPAATGGEK